MSESSKSREWNSSVYHRLSQPQVSWGKKVLARLRLRGDEIVLDAGCGTGRLTAELLEALPRGRVVAIDLSQNMLNSAREHLLGQSGNRVRLAAADLLHLPFAGVFDGIVSTAAFHWVLDHDQLFSSLRRALRPGGWLEAQCGGGPNLCACAREPTNSGAAPRFAAILYGFSRAMALSKCGRSRGNAAPSRIREHQNFHRACANCAGGRAAIQRVPA